MSAGAQRDASARATVVGVTAAGRVPNFLVIGAMKAGTTSLHQYLKAHPQVFMSTPKELNFFVEGMNWELGIEWYRSKFAGARDAVAVGESCPQYTKAIEYPGVPARIAATIPDVRLVYLVRDPIERIRSAYLHRRSNGKESRSIERALAEDERYVDTSRYAAQLDPYLELFPEEQLLVVLSEELRDDRETALGRVLKFVGVDEGLVPHNLDADFHTTEGKRERPPSINAALQAPRAKRMGQLVPVAVKERAHRWLSRRPLDTDVRVPEPLRARLADELAEDVARLRRFLPADFDGWGLT